MKKRNYFHTIIIFITLIIIASSMIMCNTIPDSMLPKEDDDAKTLLEKARNIYERNAPNKAVEVYQILIDKYPNERRTVAWAYYEMGFILFDLKKWEESFEKFEIVVKEYKVDNKAAYIIAYKYFKRIKYAFETGNMEVLKHNSSYYIPNDYDPFKNEKEKNETDEENNDSENDNNNEENNNNTNDDTEENSENNSNNNSSDENNTENEDE